MEEMDYRKTFKFVLYQGDVVLYEKVFEGENISPFTRNSIDIRKRSYRIIRELQSFLSSKQPNTIYSVGDKNYDFYKYRTSIINSYRSKYGWDVATFDYKPEIDTKKVGDKEFGGVPCMFGLYINDNPIIERKFYVEGFNPTVRWSVDLVETLNSIVDGIEREIIETDVGNMWDDNDIITRTGMTINQVRELSNWDRKRWLNRCRG